jgi:hypothetical protein
VRVGVEDGEKQNVGYHVAAYIRLNNTVTNADCTASAKTLKLGSNPGDSGGGAAAVATADQVIVERVIR